MTRFNRTFYDLNHERQYCFAAADDTIPAAVLSDMKISVPSYTDTPVISSIFLKEDTVQVMVSVGGEIVVTYSSHNRAMLRKGRIYPMKSRKEGYEGWLVFGELTNDVNYAGGTRVSEECLTRYAPSAVPYVSVPCTNTRLTGEVKIGGDTTHTQSYKEDLPGSVFEVEKTLILDLVDTGTADAANPMVLYANGVNAFNETEDIRSPIYTLCGFMPDQEGNVFVRFEDHFQIAAVTQGDERDEIGFSAIAATTEITQDMVCDSPVPEEKDTEEEEEEACLIEFLEVEHA